MRAHRLEPCGALLDTFLELIVTGLSVRADDLAVYGRALPGALEALIAVGAMAGVHQSALTGNLYPLAVLRGRSALIRHVSG